MNTSASDYQAMSQAEHIFKICDTYIGSDEHAPRDTWVLNLENQKIEMKSITLPQAVERLFLEIISNAGDNADRSIRNGIPCKLIKVEMTPETITVINDGAPIPIEMHPTEGVWVPELIFGRLLTSSNYDTSKVRMGCGRNGYGAKLVNIFSKSFEIEVGDSIRKLKYQQRWTDHMSQRSDPEITEYKGDSFVRVTYDLDFDRFNYKEYPSEAFELFARYTIDFSLTCKVPVQFNDYTYKQMTVYDYSKLYFGEISNHITHQQKQGNTEVEVCILDTPNEGVSISFVNGMMTMDGGVHVQSVIKSFSSDLLSIVNEGVDKSVSANINDVKNNVSMIIVGRIPDPKFTSQTKTSLAGPTPKVQFQSKTLEEVKKWKLLQTLYALVELKQFGKLSKTDGKKKRLVDVGKGEDANFAGTQNSHKCTLYVVEGKSAMGYAVKDISLVPKGRDYIGVYPMKGKLLNAMNANAQQIAENKELCDLKQILGLRENTDYTLKENFDTLRYGKLVILADSDDDGKHIIGLILNYIFCRFRTLLQRGFVLFRRTPILRVTHGSNKLKFYTHGQYEEWVSKTPDYKIYKHKYYKGLGTSSDKDIADDFKDPRVVICIYDDTTEDSLRLAFDSKQADQRKGWIARWRDALQVEDLQMQPISDFVSRELIHFVKANMERSLPRFLDGLKISQRKALWAAVKKWMGSGSRLIKDKPAEMKVAQFASYVAGETNYAHGEMCLAATIVGMAQDFVGANNLPYFTQDGQFGTRNLGGKDAANTRYSYTRPEWWLSYVFKKEDLALLDFVIEEGEEVEPITFLPIIPMQLVNGSVGIGSGYSTFIPNHNPIDIVDWLVKRINGLTPDPIKPWYKGFIGTITITNKKYVRNINENGEVIREEHTNPDHPVGIDAIPEPESGLTMVTRGKYSTLKKSVKITELPIGRWTTDAYREYVKMVKEKIASDVQNRSTHDKINFELMSFKHVAGYDTLKLQRGFGLTNMNTLDNENTPQHHESTQDILEQFYQQRLHYYELRKKNMLEKIQSEIRSRRERMNLISAILSGELVVFKRKKEDILKDFERLGLNKDLFSHIRLTNMSEDEVADLQSEIDGLSNDFENLTQTPPTQLWLNDLDDFKKEYIKRM